ncbi:hypothetical protein SNE40_018124 [Patella caerulea]|uniref:Uncharacterized protein n=1 Tax=Patella caerulea TaxID=87958 RepID=A0AAN8J7T7_PATCE
MRFREKPVAFVADIRAMFHQVKGPVDQWDFLRFLWWPAGDTEKEVEEYQMTVHFFGAVSSLSVCNFALKRTAEVNITQYEENVTETIMKNFYVDDCLKSTYNVQEAVVLANCLREASLKGGFISRNS